MAGDFVADNDEPQIAIDRMILEMRADESEGIDQARNILVRPDPTGVQKVRAPDLVAFEQTVEFLRRRRGLEEARIGRAVDHTHAIARYCQKVLDVSPSGIRDRDYAAGAQQSATESVQSNLFAE